MGDSTIPIHSHTLSPTPQTIWKVHYLALTSTTTPPPRYADPRQSHAQTSQYPIARSRLSETLWVSDSSVWIALASAGACALPLDRPFGPRVIFPDLFLVAFKPTQINVAFYTQKPSNFQSAMTMVNSQSSVKLSFLANGTFTFLVFQNPSKRFRI
jgi:hypothetical protein